MSDKKATRRGPVYEERGGLKFRKIGLFPIQPGQLATIYVLELDLLADKEQTDLLTTESV